MRKPNEFEQEVLDVVLKELRRAMRMKGQLHVTIDPWLAGDGCYVFASPNTVGRTYEVFGGDDVFSRVKRDRRRGRG